MSRSSYVMMDNKIRSQSSLGLIQRENNPQIPSIYNLIQSSSHSAFNRSMTHYQSIPITEDQTTNVLRRYHSQEDSNQLSFKGRLFQNRELPPPLSTPYIYTPCSTGLSTFRLRYRDNQRKRAIDVPKALEKRRRFSLDSLETSSSALNQVCLEEKNEKISVNISLRAREVFEKLCKNPRVANRINELLQCFLKENFSCNSVFSKMCPPRRGKWSKQEWDYTKQLIRCYRLGILKDYPWDDLSLREHLIIQLNSDPVRVSNKLKNDEYYHHSISNKKLWLYINEAEKYNSIIKQEKKLDQSDIQHVALASRNLIELMEHAKNIDSKDAEFELTLLKNTHQFFLHAILSDVLILTYEKLSGSLFSELNEDTIPKLLQVMEKIDQMVLLHEIH